MIQALLAGRICDIVRHVRAGDLAAARNLAANTPGIIWAQRLPAATYAALFGLPVSAPPGETDDVVQMELSL